SRTSNLAAISGNVHACLAGFGLVSVHARTAATTSAIQGGFVRMVASLKDGARLSGEYPVNTTNGLPDSRSFRATGSHVSPPRLTSRTATSHPGSSRGAFATDVAGPTTSSPAEASCWLTSRPIIHSSSTTSTRALTTLPLEPSQNCCLLVA